MFETRLKPYTKRNLLGYDHITQFEGEALVCLSLPAIAIIRGLLRVEGLDYLTYHRQLTETGYHTLTNVEWDEVDAIVSEALGELDVALTSDLVDAIRDLVQVTAETACCNNGSGGAGNEDVPESPHEDDGVTPPPDWTDHAEYRIYKCNQADRIIEDMITDLTWIRNGTILTLVASAAVAAFVSPVPFSRVAAIIGLAVTWLAQGLLIQYADELKDELENDKQDYLCTLYAASNVANAELGMENELNSSGISAPARLLAGYFLGPDSLNRLFENTHEQLPTADCSGCTCNLFEILTGTVITETHNKLIIEEEDNQGAVICGSIEVRINYQGGAYCGAQWDFDTSVEADYSSCAGETSYDLRIQDQEGNLHKGIDEMPDGPWLEDSAGYASEVRVIGERNANWRVRIDLRTEEP